SIFAPAHEPKRCGAIEIVVFTRAFPDEMPRILWIHAYGPFPAAWRGIESARMSFLEVALAIRQRISVIPGRRRHESDAKDGAVGRVAKAIHGDSLLLADFAKRTRQRGFRKRIANVGPLDLRRDFQEVVSLDAWRRLRK